MTFEESYQIDSSPFASSSSATIYKCTHRVTGEVCAVKKYKITSISERRLKLVENEVEIASRISYHVNIIGVRGLYKDYNSNNAYLVMEWMKGGNLLDWLQKNGPFSEPVAKHCIRQILYGLVHIHACHVMHRDIKPENIFLKTEFDKSKMENFTLAIGDFGFATDVIPNSEYMGSPQYSAPETALIALRGCSDKNFRPLYNEKCDIWSVGVLTFVLITGLLPFDGATPTEVFHSVLRNEIPYNKLTKNTSLTNINKVTLFIKRMTETNPSKRVDASTALRDPWLNEELDEYNELEQLPYNFIAQALCKNR